jgi:hypothetical protein
MQPIAYYVTAHGYGHGVRSCDIIRALQRLHPDVPVVLVSDLPGDFLRNRIGPGTTAYRPGSFDTGMVQLDSIRVDLAESLRKAERLCSVREQLIRQECKFLRDGGFRGIVADIPAIPFEAARRAGIPGVAVSNFSWDWIYSEFREIEPRWDPVIEAISEGYRQARVLLRLPFADDMRVFSRIEDIPVVAEPGTNRRAELAQMTGADPGKKWILLSFTTLEWEPRAVALVESLKEYEFFTVLPLAWDARNFHAVDRGVVRFADVMASADGVISKPGFGIVSDCVVNEKPFLYADRANFREYDVLVRSIRRHLRSVHIPVDELYAGSLRPWLEELWRCPPPAQPARMGGGEVAARRIIAELVP